MREAAKPFRLEELPTVEQALQRLLNALPAHRPVEEQVPLEEAVGRVLAREVRSREAVPAFPRSLVDGYAVRAADTAPGGGDPRPRLRLMGRVRMGQAPGVAVGPGEAVWVPTGGMVPAGADAVVPVEETEPDATGTIVVTVPAVPGSNVLPAGADLAAGEVVLTPGHRLRPQDVGVLASVGCVTPWVYRRPVVAIYSTGDELVPPERQPAPGQIRDANAYALAAAVRSDGAVARIGGIVADDPGAWRDALQAGLRDDLVIVSGGSSVGLDDLAADIVQELGSPGILVHGVRMAPGKPTLLALVGDRVVCGLPGNPVSALVTYELFVRPVLRWRMGCRPVDPWRATVRARLAADVRAPRGRELHARVRLDVAQGQLVAEPLRGGSAQLTSLVRADGLITVPVDKGVLQAGETVDVRLFP